MFTTDTYIDHIQSLCVRMHLMRREQGVHAEVLAVVGYFLHATAT